MPLAVSPASTPGARWTLSLAGKKLVTIELQQKKQRTFSNNATMFPNLKRFGGSPAFWDRTLCCRRWRSWDLAAAGVAVGLRTVAGGHAQLRRGIENQSERIIGRTSLGLRASVGSLRFDCGSNVAGYWASCEGASTLEFDCRAGSRVVLGLDAVGRFRELGRGIGQLSTFAIHSTIGCRQVSYGWKRRERKGEDESISNGWNDSGETAVRGTHQAKRVHRAASNAHAAVEPNISEAVLRKGALLEFERESGKVLLAVLQNREGKKNWTAIDQNGNTHTVRPQQITYLVPYPEDFEPSDIVKFLGKVENLQDLGLLEFAWEELLADKVVQAESLAKILYSQDTPVECYTAHRMLSGNQIYFRCKQKGLTPIYEPRPLSQVRELQQKRLVDEKAHELLLSYVNIIKLALKCPLHDKPPQSTWHAVNHFHVRTESLKAYALSSCLNAAEKKCAEEDSMGFVYEMDLVVPVEVLVILLEHRFGLPGHKKVIEIMGLTKNPAVVVNLLIGMGVFPLHVNVDLLKVKNLVEFTEEHVAAAEQLGQSHQADPDLDNRVDLTAMKVYTIDSDDTDEIDDGLSATRLPDGQIKVWVHVADPTRWLPQGHILTREAESRGTSMYLPTGTIPMFPMELATGKMSLQQGCKCCAVTVSIILLEDGSIAEYSVMNSTICPTYKLSYDNVGELLLMHVEEEPELYLLAEAATRRTKWRINQGAILTFVPEPEIKVTDPDSTEPSIVLDVKDQSVPAMQLVAEMMILCGEAISLIGEENRLCLPYRGQAKTDFPHRILSNIPEGPCRAFAVRRLLGSADLSFTKPIPHASLGLAGYVQFTSPIRRYADLISHYQVKAYMRGDAPPFTVGNLEAKMAMANIRTKDARRLQTSAERYWTLEYLRRLPRDRKYQAVVLRYLKDREVSVLLLEVGLRTSLQLSSTPSVGSEVRVIVVSADPRKDVISLRQC